MVAKRSETNSVHLNNYDCTIQRAHESQQSTTQPTDELSSAKIHISGAPLHNQDATTKKAQNRPLTQCFKPSEVELSDVGEYHYTIRRPHESPEPGFNTLSHV